MKKSIIVITVICFVFSPAISLGEIIRLKDGQEVRGDITYSDKDKIKVETIYGEIQLDKSQVTIIAESEVKENKLLMEKLEELRKDWIKTTVGEQEYRQLFKKNFSTIQDAGRDMETGFICSCYLQQ
ncbi:MAG: hypothetical protein ABH873_08585 [Candidatus Firestonebacteria bacterium]